MAGKQAGSALSLRTTLLLFVASLLILLLLVSSSLGMARFRDYLAGQLSLQASDSAVALGLTLSHGVNLQDPAAVATALNAMFDSGHYRLLAFINPKGETVAARAAPETPDSVPAWFRDWAALPAPEGRAEVSDGWSRKGSVRVIVHPGQAYKDLWASLKSQLFWFAVIGFLALAVAAWGVSRLLRPLKALEQQVWAVQQHEFGRRVPLPASRELRRVALAINQMAEDLGNLFEGQVRLIDGLRRETQEDPVTRLQSRAAFNRRLRGELEDEEGSRAGTLILLRLKGFAEFNDQFGRAAGDTLLFQVAGRIGDFVRDHPGAFAGRSSGAEFSLFLPGVTAVDASHWLNILIERIEADYAAQAGHLEVAVHAGMARTGASRVTSSQLLSQADAALRQAESGGRPSQLYQGTVDALPADRWRAQLEKALHNGALTLFFQPVQDLEGRILFNQVLSRLELEGETLAASLFVPLAERFGLAPALDRLVLERMAPELRACEHCGFSVTLAPATLADDNFIQWLDGFLAELGDGAGQLWLSVQEEAIRHQPTGVARLVELAHEHGARILVDRFGVGGVSFDYLYRWPIDAVRLDRSFIRDIHQRSDSLFFLRSMLPIARSLRTRVYVTGVEGAAEWECVRAEGVDGAMGFHLGRPGPEPR